MAKRTSKESRSNPKPPLPEPQTEYVILEGDGCVYQPDGMTQWAAEKCLLQRRQTVPHMQTEPARVIRAVTRYEEVE